MQTGEKPLEDAELEDLAQKLVAHFKRWGDSPDGEPPKEAEEFMGRLDWLKDNA